MKQINIDRGWTYRNCFIDSLGMLEIPGEEVNLPHDGMIGTDVSKDAPAGIDSGFYNGVVCSYTKYIDIPADWEGECVGLKFDGAMMHATIEVNGCKVGEHHYGYTPFYVDISEYVSYGAANRITINTNTGVQPSSRWYTGAGLIRSVYLCHSPRVYIAPDGLYVYTKEVSDGKAFLEAQVDICNADMSDRIVNVKLELIKDGADKVCASVSKTICVSRGKKETAYMSFILVNPEIWDVNTPNLYVAKATVTDMGEYRTHFTKSDINTQDETTALFGVRTISVDSLRGLRINGKTVKLKGGCVHHDNGLLGAVSLYESEARKVRKLKEIGFNAIRTAHNPPSAALVEACDREGMYIFDEAFDAWGMAKRPGDFSTYYEYLWKEEATSYVRRDRIHPAVIMWSTGNEIPERGGLDKGYRRATELARLIKSLDGSRPVSNGICSFWSGLDDELAKKQNREQNAKNEGSPVSWEEITEPFTNGLDVVGYNYMEEQYEKDHERFPDRVILGSENFPKEIGFRWPVVERLPYVIGDFTWTAWDYIGEAGIGKSVFVEPDDPLVAKGSWAIMPQSTSYYPWRLANDADYDITGHKLAQGAYRSVVWGNTDTYIYVQNPMHFNKTEVIGMWGFTDVTRCWNYEEYAGKKIKVLVFSNADEVELIVNGTTIARKHVSMEIPLPHSACFETDYFKGRVEAVSYKDGKEVSRDMIETAGEPEKILLKPEKTELTADGHDLCHIAIEVSDSNGRIVPDAEIKLEAEVQGRGYLAGFGTGNPITEENYTDCNTATFRGRALAIIRSGYESSEVRLKVRAAGLSMIGECVINVK